MLPTKLFRNMIPFINRSGHRLKVEHFSNLDGVRIVEPSPSSWGTCGLAPLEGDDTMDVDVQGAATLLLAQFNEKVLPGSTRDEEVRKRVAKLQEEQGRKIGKKEYREVRDDVEIMLLAKAMIRRTFVPIMFIGDYILVFTSSVKRADTIITNLVVGYGPGSDKQIRLHNLNNCVVNAPANIINSVAQGLATETESGDVSFLSTTNVVLKGTDKQIIRVKDKDVGSHDVQELLKQAWTPERVGMSVYDGSDETVLFTLTDKLIFTGIKSEGVKADKDDDAKFNNIWITAQNMRLTLDGIVEVLGGLHAVETMDEPGQDKKRPVIVASTPAFDEEEDEL